MTKVAILGAGFGGLCMAITLRKAGIESFTIVEKGAGVGGTWRDNSYPGAACDIMSHLYSYSFEKKPDWSKNYAEQDEILGYLEHCTKKYDLTDRIELSTEIREAAFDDRTRTWTLVDADGREGVADVLVTACGQLNRPAYPRVANLESFAGPAFHSARWDHGCDLSGKRVGVIGTGASAIQFVPPVAEQAKELTVFQRSAPWVLPKIERTYSEAEKWLLERAPALEGLSRGAIYAWGETRRLAFREGGLYNHVVEMVAKRHLRSAVADERLRKALLPDYPPGCKRLLISNDYFPAMARPNVRLVTDGIEAAEPGGLRTSDGAFHPLDVLIFGTGFETTSFLSPMTIRGPGGRNLEEAWRDGAEAYLGIAVSGFPNLFLLYGPNTNLAHNSVLFMIEAQARYVARCIAMLGERGAREVEVKEERMRSFVDEMQRRFRGSVWEAGCTNWYRTASGRHTNNWPGFTFEYWWRTRAPRPSDFVFS